MYVMELSVLKSDQSSIQSVAARFPLKALATRVEKFGLKVVWVNAEIDVSVKNPKIDNPLYLDECIGDI
jgi:hypothetical protein